LGLFVFIGLFVSQMLIIVIPVELFAKLFGLYYKLVYLCGAIRMNCAFSFLSAGGRMGAKER
jgi:hypothetical protein